MHPEPSFVAARLQENLANVRERIAAAAGRAGRTIDEIKLVGVTKYVEPPLARMLFEAGLSVLGESRPQELWRKAEALADLPVEWHLIGHLQRNKVKRTLPLVTLFHSVDSLRLLAEISHEAVQLDCDARVLLEVNVSGDQSKHGLKPGEVEPLLPQVAALPQVCVEGLMTMAALEGGLDRAHRDFAALRDLRDRLQPNCPPGLTLRHLSMGMSGDFEAAIEEGATLIRIGSTLFEGLEEPMGLAH
jgi:pyridoxal phosphate enzyme (YggS family)